MRYPLDNMQVVQDGGFGTDPATYRQFNLNGHNGVDLMASIGTPVYAPEDANVFYSANGVVDQYTGAPISGEVIVLKGTMEHWLLHLSKRLVGVANHVKEGQLIGYSGNTGFTTGPHLHWGIRPILPDIRNGFRGFIDPMEFMKSQGGDDVIDTEDKARDVFLAVLHEPNPTQDAIKSIINQPYSTVVPSLIGYSKWKDQNDKLVAYPNLYDTAKGLQQQINLKSDSALREAVQDAVNKFKKLGVE